MSSKPDDLYVHYRIKYCWIKFFRTFSTKIRTCSEFQDISGHTLKFQEFQDNAQACIFDGG